MAESVFFTPDEVLNERLPVHPETAEWPPVVPDLEKVTPMGVEIFRPHYHITKGALGIQILWTKNGIHHNPCA